MVLVQLKHQALISGSKATTRPCVWHREHFPQRENGSTPPNGKFTREVRDDIPIAFPTVMRITGVIETGRGYEIEISKENSPCSFACRRCGRRPCDGWYARLV